MNQKYNSISIIIIFRNEEKHIKNCIKSVLNQTYPNFELILVNDSSTDRSKQIVLQFNDKRIRYYENKENLGIAKSRNIGLSKAKGKYIFFTDADCITDNDWITQGLRYLKKGFVGVGGKVIYSSKNHHISDKVVECLKPGYWPTANIGYDTNTLRNMGGFDINFKNVGSDRDIALRVQKNGKLYFNKKMIVYHAVKKWNPKKLIEHYKEAAASAVYLTKKHKDTTNRIYRIVFPRALFAIFFPPALLIEKASKYKIQDFYDIKILFAIYLGILQARYHIWKTATKERIFLI